MHEVRIGIIGFGGIAQLHSKYLLAGEVPGAKLTAVCDINPEQLKNIGGNGIKTFIKSEELFKSGLVDAVMIATPHYYHPPLAIEALKHNLHVLIEKPAGVYTKQVIEMNDFASRTDKVFAIMFNCRCKPIFKKLKEMIDAGELGNIKRTNWIITDW
jgi:predicted dehydrogenase